MKNKLSILLFFFVIFSVQANETTIRLGKELSELLQSILGNESTFYSNNLDAPSFIEWAFSQIGIKAPNTIEELLTFGEYIPKSSILSGDILFFKINSNNVNHAAIYLGNNKFAHIPQQGDILQEESLSSNDWMEHLETARRITKEDVIDSALEKLNVIEITQSHFVTYVDPNGHPNNDPGFLRFYTQDVSEKQLLLQGIQEQDYVYGTNDKNPNIKLQEVKSGIIPNTMTYKRPLEIKDSIEFITIHDTGDNKFNASQWKDEITTSEREVSWHFTVDDKEIYQHVPLNEVCFHAGDGKNKFKLTDTGVEFTVENPEIKFNTEDNFLYINGKKTNLEAPKDEEGNYQHNITDSGLYTEKGENGNYFINHYYYSVAYKKVSNGGGNRNSIGIETCIYDGVIYSKVMRKTANLVSHLLNLYNLLPRRVLQHRHFSGKLCPQSMIRAKESSPFAYNYFKELVEAEYFILKNLPNAKFNYKSNNQDLLDNEGYLLKYVDKDTDVSYEVSVEYDGIIKTKVFTTKIHPLNPTPSSSSFLFSSLSLIFFLVIVV